MKFKLSRQEKALLLEMIFEMLMSGRYEKLEFDPAFNGNYIETSIHAKCIRVDICHLGRVDVASNKGLASFHVRWPWGILGRTHKRIRDFLNHQKKIRQERAKNVTLDVFDAPGTLDKLLDGKFIELEQRANT